MEIDGQMIGVTNSQGRARSINGVPPFYIGGLNGQGASSRARANLGVSVIIYEVLDHKRKLAKE